MFAHRLLRLLLVLTPGLALLISGCTTSGDGFVAQLKNLRPKSFAATEEGIKDPAGLYVSYAQWQEQQHNYPEAREKYNAALAANPESADAIIGLARIDQLAGRTRAAEDGFRKALKLEPNNPRVLDAAGQFYVQEKRWPEARDMLNRAMRSAPEDKSIRYHFAIALLKSGDIAGAETHLVATIGQAAAHFNIGLALHEKGQLDEAKDQMLQAVTLNPQLTNAQDWLKQIQREQQARQITNHSPQGSPRTAAGPILQTGGWSAHKPQK